MSAWKVYWTDLREDKMCQTYPIWNYAVLVVVSVTTFGMVCVSWILLHISFSLLVQAHSAGDPKILH
jgi:hypothetical protein